MSTSNCNHATCQGEVCRREVKPKNKFSSIKKKPLKPKENQDELDIFFEKIMLENEPICANCGAFAPSIKFEAYKRLWKASQAHILPKRHFKSIATNPINMLVMFPSYSGVCDCHTNYDNSWMQASSMNVWPIVVERFKILYPLISPKEHQYIPFELLKTLVDIPDDFEFPTDL